MKQHIKINLYNECNSSMIEAIGKIVGGNNGGNQLFSIYDFIAVIKYKKLELPYSFKDINYEVCDNKVLLSSTIDDNEVYFCTLEWVLLHDLNVSHIPGDELSESLTTDELNSLNEFIDRNLAEVDKEMQNEALKECNDILGNKKSTIEGEGDE